KSAPAPTMWSTPSTGSTAPARRCGRSSPTFAPTGRTLAGLRPRPNRANEMAMRRENVLDTETTGLDPRSGHRIIEIAGIEVEDFVPTGRHFHRYIDPERDIDVDAERVHGISRAFLTGKPRFADREIVEEFLEFVQDSPLIAHNAPF